MKANFVYEKFTDVDTDPVVDMGIGRIHDIEKWIDSVYYDKISGQQNECFKSFINGSRSGDLLHKKNIVIRKDFSIDLIDGWVDFSSFRDRIPDYIKFNTINGDFSCNSSNFPPKKLPKKVTNMLRYFINRKYFNIDKFSKSNVKKYCNAHIIDCTKDTY